MLSQPNDTDHQVPKADDAGHNAPDEATSAVTDQAAQVREQAVRAGADTARQDTEAERTTMEGGLNMASQMLERITDQFMQVLGFNGPHSVELAQRWSEKVQVLAQASTVQAQGTQRDPQEVCG